MPKLHNTGQMAQVNFGSAELVGGTGIELDVAKPNTIGAAPTCSGYAEFEPLGSSGEFR
jgi:hypothetical protein